MKVLPLGRLVLTWVLAATVGAVAMAADPPAEDRSPPGDAKPAAEKTSTEKPSSDKPATPKAVPLSQRPETIEKFARYYLDMYGLHLKSRDWMARAMGVISLARLDDPRATEKLMQTMLGDRDELVRIYAWEALHGRQERLTEQQRHLWIRTAFDLQRKDALRGDLRLALIGLIEAGGPTVQNKKIFKKIFKNTNSINPSDINTLYALGDMLKRWKSPDLAGYLIDSMKDLDDAYRAEVVLRRIHDKIPRSSTMRMQSSRTMWDTTRKRWRDWLKEAKYKEILKYQCKPYAGKSKIMPGGWKITDTADPRWRKDLELRKFRLDQLDVGIVLDTTASMGRPLAWVKRDVVKMMRAFEMISREPRIGVTLYRDHGDQYVTRNIPLTSNARSLAKALRPCQPKGGGDVPEAVYEALRAMIKKQKWSPSKTARKVILLISDAPPQQKTLGKIEQLVTEAVEDRFLVHAIKVRTSKYVERRLNLPNYDKEMKTFDDIARWGNGRSVWVQFWTQSSSGRWQGTARQPGRTGHLPGGPEVDPGGRLPRPGGPLHQRASGICPGTLRGEAPGLRESRPAPPGRPTRQPADESLSLRGRPTPPNHPRSPKITQDHPRPS
ncbi:MAG: VWA domain-containing protein [Anaerolineaceae bacterium]|nr:VWA domain-containing protein [Anaerolineaceae bacterium]